MAGPKRRCWWVCSLGALLASGVHAAPILQILPEDLRVSVGGTNLLTVTCTDCNFTSSGRLEFLTDDGAIATVSSDPEIFVLNSEFITAVSLNGVAVGSTVFRARLFEGFSTTPALEAVATVTVTERFECPIETLARGAPQSPAMLETMRRFRDEVLSRSPRGRRYIRLFYRHGFEVTLILLRDRNLRDRAFKALLDLRPVIEAAAEGQPARLSHARRIEIEGILHELHEVGSPALRRGVRHIRRELQTGKTIAGIRIERRAER